MTGVGTATGVAREGACPTCASIESDEQWLALPLVQAIGASELSVFMTTDWAGRVVEVRRCLACGRAIARIVPCRTPAA